jgi:phage gp36-like protein
MPYVTKADMLAVIPADHLTAALDDRNYGDDTENVWDIIATAASRRVDAILGARYPVPFASPYPALVGEAAVVFAAYMLFLRRAAGEANPWKKEADDMAARLQRVAEGSADLSVAPGDDDAVAITEPSKTYNEQGRILL